MTITDSSYAAMGTSKLNADPSQGWYNHPSAWQKYDDE
eukprot:CAMPEP_0174917946 /NCGR_PEP_ID=MMETSP1355-20121228/2799_1 /TAXON_ID=464990 /ORGANISM="Hemiselmis tepida, Strain CCMP443" /LENGTH=37 /DNA_ID= /DNA_START= /DNA_END= /DNA_ORIENTATION=